MAQVKFYGYPGMLIKPESQIGRFALFVLDA